MFLLLPKTCFQFSYLLRITQRRNKNDRFCKQSWRWKLHAPPKHRLHFNWLKGGTSHNAVIFLCSLLFVISVIYLSSEFLFRFPLLTSHYNFRSASNNFHEQRRLSSVIQIWRPVNVILNRVHIEFLFLHLWSRCYASVTDLYCAKAIYVQYFLDAQQSVNAFS